ncbi:MAG TPA: retropepsin-like aspartic protease [Aggregatilinea sp.]|uniref:retropepsin-like aspartic protease n=1 Tax=Aggregatilinea sp. TaxID=2806333 RepID=UPI002C3607FD|nr:retropepsin-like aspartic protease [Aggregatilinea sp.]HML23010.1 retropepsin-like aspartic protease [Aggregatilinea sp.]
MSELTLIIDPDPDEIDAAGVFVDGTIADRPYRFLLDTGAATSSVVEDDTTAVFPPAGQHQSSGVFAPSSNDLIAVPRLTVGPIERAPFTLTRTPRDAPGISSLIGMDVLKDHCCYFLFGQNRVLLDDDTAFSADAPRHDLMFDSKFHPYLMVDFEGGAQAQTVWDTGAALTVADAAFIAAHPALFTPAGRSTGTDSTGTDVETPMYVMARCIIGGETFPAVRVAGVDLGPVNAMIERRMDMILGYSLIRHADWLFDFPRARWAVTRREA